MRLAAVHVLKNQTIKCKATACMHHGKCLLAGPEGPPYGVVTTLTRPKLGNLIGVGFGEVETHCQSVDMRQPKRLSEMSYQVRVLRALKLRKGKFATPAMLAKQLGVKTQSVGQVLANLFRKGDLVRGTSRRVGSTSGPYEYQLSKMGAIRLQEETS